jgi:hypothetical protein
VQLLARNPGTQREALFFAREVSDLLVDSKEAVPAAVAHSASSALVMALANAKRAGGSSGRQDIQMWVECAHWGRIWMFRQG